MRYLVSLTIFFTLLVPVSITQAQTSGPEDIIASGIDITVNPELPGPNTEVRAQLDSSSTDLDQSNITWSINGQKISSGKGLRSASLTTGPAGSKTTISVTVVSPDGTFTKSLVLEGGTVDLLWQGETYTPPFYKGRSLWSFQTRMTLLAIPHITGKTTQNLSFKWTKDGTVLGSSSGTGKDSLLVFDTILGLPQNISVDVLTDRNTVVASASITLEPKEPEAKVYENNPALGFVFEKEVTGTLSLKNKEVTLTSFPYNFGTSKRANSNLVYSWITNSGTKTGNEVTYRTPEGSGSSSVSSEIKSLTQILQEAHKDFLVQFSNDNSN